MELDSLDTRYLLQTADTAIRAGDRNAALALVRLALLLNVEEMIDEQLSNDHR